MIVALSKAGHFMNLPFKRYYSLSTKFFLFVMAGLTIISTVSILLFYKDFTFLKTPGADISRVGFTEYLYEFLFAIFILYSGACAVAYQYRKNFNTAMKYQLAAFSAVEKENYNVMVPVVTEDEFSLIAIGTNRMIAGLQEKDKIKKAFGKYMSPSVANAILASERGTSLEGRLVNPVVMFIDIRNYTIFAESRAPQEVVGMLNTFFSLVVKCVYEHRGVVDKFIGDAAMAIFGLDETEKSCEDAIKTALNIIHLMPSLNENLQARGLPPISIGIGIHNGPAIAGNIGSEERLEYTVIGDAVNIASRLQSLNKTLNTTLTVSEPIYQAVPPELQSLFTFKGSHPLKGKSYELPVYSL
jgi:adenylate cyclase